MGALLHERLDRFDEAEQAYRKALEIDAGYAWAWAQLGALLHERLDRFVEAEDAYRKAVELEPDLALAWFLLGQLLHERLDRFDEAEDAYRKALELEPHLTLAWALLGQLLHERLDRFDEAEDAYRKALELEPRLTEGWLGLLVLTSQGVLALDGFLSFAEQCIQRSDDDPAILNNIANAVCVHGSAALLPAGEAWARKACEKVPGDLAARTTLAEILVALGRGSEALQELPDILADSAFVQAQKSEITDLLIDLASVDRARETVRILRQSPVANQLEPLEVALRMYIGEEVNVAQEIAEVAKDVVDKIKQRRAELENEGPPV